MCGGMADGAGESEACRCCWARANRGSRALLGSILEEEETRISVNNSTKCRPPQKYLKVTGSAWENLNPIFIQSHKEYIQEKSKIPL